MKKRQFVFGLLVLMVFGITGYGVQEKPEKQSPAATVRTETGQKLDDYLTRLEKFGFAGGILVAKDGAVILEKGYGLANREQNIPNAVDTVFNIGSITKQFTAAAILKLEMQGKLRVEDPINKYLPGVPKDKAGITIHHLLTHSAGLRSDYAETDYEPVGREEYVKRAMAEPLLSPPGERFEYANSGYSLLAAIVEMISGQSYEQFLYNNLFKPAGMLHTGYCLPKWSADKQAHGYLDGRAWGTVVEKACVGEGPYWALRGNGGIQATVGDMYRWHQALEGNTILSAEARRKFQTPYIAEGPQGFSHYAYGWAIMKTPRGTKLVTHNGGNGIFAADFRRYVDENVVVFIASNADVKAIPASQHIARILFGMNPTFPPKVVEAESAKLARLGGTYTLPSGAKLAVSAKPDRLVISPEGQEAFSLLATGNPAVSPRLNEINTRTAAIVEQASKGNFEPIHQAFGGNIPLASVKARETEMWKDWRERFGEFKSCTVLGTLPMEERMATTARLSFERGEILMRYAWEEGQLIGIRPLPQMTGKAFLPVSPSTFAIYDVMSGDSLTIRFETDASGAATKLIFAGEKEVTAKKTD
ncbi:MAG: serine hydrolase [Acidobacteria bacterium]|nr:serine hydrolase [Acidobacteriota bacterium]